MIHLNRTAPASLMLTSLALASAIVVSCATTPGPVATVDKTKNEMTVYSTSDARSGMSDARPNADVAAASKKLEVRSKENPDDKSALLDLAQLQLAQGKLDESEASVRRVLRIDLKNVPAKKILGQIALRRGQLDLASVIFAGIDDSKDSSILNMQGLIELKRGQNDKAMALFKSAIQADSKNLAARMNLGVLYLKYRQINAAAVEFERILNVLPSHQDARLHMGIVYNSRSQYEKAEPIFEGVLKEDEKNPLALFNLAVCQKGKGDSDAALETLQTYVEVDKGRSQNSTEVFALIDQIQKDKKQSGDPVSDEQIQALAAKVGGPEGEGEEQGPNNSPQDKKGLAKAEEQPAKSSVDSAVDEGSSSEVEDVDDVKSLEAELEK